MALKLTREIALQQPAQEASAATLKVVAELETKPKRDYAGFELFYPGAGHARDNIVVWFPQQKVLFGGCFIKSVTATNLVNIADAVLSEWTPAIKRLQKKYKNIRTVVPGHGTIQGDSLAHDVETS